MNNCKSTDFKYLSSKANAEKKLFDKGAIDVYNKIINLEIFNDLALQFLEFVKKEFNLDPTSVISGRFGDSVIFNNDVFRKVDKVRGYDKINAENIRKQLAALEKPTQEVKPGVELVKKLQTKLQSLYPEIKLNITNNPIWEQGNNILNQLIEDDYFEGNPKYFTEIEKISNLILNKLKFKVREFNGKYDESITNLEKYKSKVLNDLLKEIGITGSITNLNELKERLSSKELQISLKENLEQVKESKENFKKQLDNFYSVKRLLNDYLKHFDLSKYDSSQQAIIKQYLPNLFKDNKFKSDKQAIAFNKRRINSEEWANKTFNLDKITLGFLSNNAKEKKIETLLNYFKIEPQEASERIYVTIENELNRREKFFTSEKTQSKINAKIAEDKIKSDNEKAERLRIRNEELNKYKNSTVVKEVEGFLGARNIHDLEAVLESSNINVELAIIKNNGYSLDKTPEGKKSDLFLSILNLPEVNGNIEIAKKLKSLVYSEDFTNWFGDWLNNPEESSKIVDENGEPKLVYHGSGREFSNFEEKERGSTTGKWKDRLSDSEMSFMFTDSPDTAFYYAIIERQEILKEILYYVRKAAQEPTSELIQEMYKKYPAIKNWVDNLKEKGLSKEEILKEFNRIYNEYSKIRDLTEGGAIGNAEANNQNTKLVIEYLEKNKESILKNGIPKNDKYNTAIIPGSEKNSYPIWLWSSKEYNTITVGNNGILNSFENKSLNGKNIKELTSIEFDLMVSEFKDTFIYNYEKIQNKISAGGFTPKIYPVFLNAKKVNKKDFNSGSFVESEALKVADLVEEALNTNLDGSIIENIKDPVTATNYAVFRSNQIKSVFNKKDYTSQDNFYNQVINGKIIGQANIKAMTVLIDAVNQKQDTLPHEYAHHYIAWFRNTPLVQEAIKKWGSEEALVQSIGEQAVKQKGEAFDWWEKFTKFVMDLFNNLSTKDKQELTNILTDAFLQGVDLETGKIGISRERSLELARKTSGLFNQEIKPGIEELFDSNPELANAVYEALGFKTNITQDNKTNISLIKEYFRPALTKEFNTPQQFADFGYTLKSTYADEIGTILRSFAENSISKEEFGNRILGVLEEQEFTSDETKDKIFHRELRTLAYTVLSRDLILNNKENILKNILKKDSSNIFELIRVDADNNKFVIRTDYGTSGIGFNPQTNEIWENDNRSILNTNVNQITPQQKQQTLQLYSQYLDSVFPDSKVKDIVYHGSKKEFTFEDYISSLPEYTGTQTTAVWVDGVRDDDRKIVRGLTELQQKQYKKEGRIETGIGYYQKDGSIKYYKNSELDKPYNNGKFEKFKKRDHSYAGMDTFLGTGNYFTTSLKNAKSYARTKLYSAVVNIKNAYTENKGYSNSRSGKGSQELIDQGYDAVTEKINDGQEYNVFEPEQIHILGSKQDIEGFKEFVEKGEVETKKENISDNNVIDENYLLLTEQEQKEFDKLQQEGLITKGLFNENKDIVYTTKNKNGLIQRLKELGINWIKIETLNNWIKVSIDTLTSQKPQVSKKINAESTQKELIDKIKSIADRLGIKIERLDVIYNKQQEINTLTKKLETASEQEKQQIQKQIDELKEFGIKKEALALADLLNSTIQLTTDDNLALLSEEVIHFLVDIVKQKNPELYAELLQKVKTYAKYQEMMNKYSKEIESGEYSLEDFQKEAIAQVLVDYLIKDETNENEYQNSKSQKFWEKIKDWASSFFDSIKNKDYDAFDRFVRDVINSDYISEEDRKYFKNGKYYYSLAPDRDTIRANIFNEKSKIGKTIINGIEKYTYEGKVVAQRVSDLVEKFYNFAFRDRGFIKNQIDSIALERGTLVHKAFENTFAKYVDPKTGELLSTPVQANKELKDFETQYPGHAKIIDDYVKDLIKEYPNGYFITEVPIINKKKTLAGTIDLMVIDKNGKVHVYDWKTKKATKFIKKTNSIQDITEIPWWNKKAWVLQLDNYANILQQNYDIAATQIGRLRAIPVLVNQDVVTGIITSLEMAPFNKNAINIKERAKIPVISEKEVTGKEAIDQILASLRAIKEDLQKRINKKQGKVNILKEDLEYIDNLITDLIVAESLDSVFLNINGILSNVADYFKDKATIKRGILIKDSVSDGNDQIFNDFQDSLKNKSKEELGEMLVEIEKLKNSLLIYRGSDIGSSILEKLTSIILYTNPNITEETRKRISSLDSSIANGITNLQTLKNIVVKEFGTRYNVEDVQSIDAEGGILSTIIDGFSSVYQQRTKVGKLVGEMFRKIDSEIRSKNKKTAERFEELRNKKKTFLDTDVSKVFQKLLREVEVVIEGEKQKVFKLIPKIDPEYYKSHKEALEKFTNGLNKNLKFFNSNEYNEITTWINDNIDVPKWKDYFDERRKDYEDYIKQLAIKQQIDFPDEYVKNKMEQFDILNDIFKSPQAFKKLENTRFIKEDKWESKEFKELKKNPVDLEIYNYFKYLNQKAISIGYLDNQGEATFIPFEVKSTDIAKSPFSYLKNYLFSKYEDDAYDDVKINPLTEQEELNLKRPFTIETKVKGNISQQLDLFKVFEKFEQALNEYETLKKSEDLITTIAELEKEKTKEKAVSVLGKILGAKAKEDTASYERIKKLVNYRLYGKKFKRDFQISTSIGNFSFLKGMRMLDSYASQLFLGFYHKVAIGAYIGSSGVALSKRTKAYRKRSLLFSMINPTESEYFGFNKKVTTIKKAFDYRINPIEKEELDLRRTNTIKNLAIVSWKYAAQTLQAVDEKIQDDLFFASLRSHYVINNKIVNIEDLKEQLYPNYYENPSKYDKEFKKYIKDKTTLKDWVDNNIKNGKLDLSSLDKESVFDFNELIKGTAKEIIGNMSSEDYSYIRVGFFANSFSKFKVWFPGVAKNFFASIHYNRETKSSSIGSFNSFASLMASSLYGISFGKNMTRTEAVKMTAMLMLPIINNKRSAAFTSFMRNKYKLYVEEAKEKGFDIEISEKQYIDAYLEKSKSFMNHVTIIAALSMLQNAFGGDDDNMFLDYISKGIGKGVQELTGIYTPPQAVKFITRTSFPQLGALGEAADPFYELLTLGQDANIWLSIVETIPFLQGGSIQEEAQKGAAKEDKTTFFGKVTRETMDAVPYVRQLNRNVLVPYNEDWQEFLGVDKNFKVR